MKTIALTILLNIGIQIANLNGLTAQQEVESVGRQTEQETPLALQAEPRTDEWWQERHAAKLKEKSAMDEVDILLLGDSITHSWESTGRKVWNKHFGDFSTLNLGYSGDRTEHVLWRLRNGEVDDIAPKVAVVMIGTNNTGHRKDDPKDIAAGIKEILAELKTRLPKTKVLLLGIFPRDKKPDGQGRKINRATNELIKEFADQQSVWFLNINDKFIDEDGTLPDSIMPDALHPNADGYEIWAKAIKDSIEKLTKTD